MRVIPNISTMIYGRLMTASFLRSTLINQGDFKMISGEKDEF